MVSTAKDFDGSNDYGTVTWARKTLPFTWACWWYPTANQGTTQNHLFTSGASASQSYYSLGVTETTGSGICCDAFSGGVGRSASFSSALANDTWHFVAGVWTSTTSRKPYRDGAFGTADTGSVSVTSSLPNGRIACRETNGAGADRFALGAISHIGMWDIALAEADLDLMWNGLHPLHCQRANLVQFLLPVDTVYRDLVSDNGASLVSAPPDLGFGPPVRPYRNRFFHSSCISEVTSARPRSFGSVIG